MKLTEEDHPERIKRFGHIKPAPIWGSVRCLANCPGQSRTCTRERGHTGLHAAHGTFSRVVAVWDGEVAIATRKRDRRMRKSAEVVDRKGLGREGLGGALRALWRRTIRRVPSLEEGFLFVLAVTMVGFAIDMALRILGWR